MMRKPKADTGILLLPSKLHIRPHSHPITHRRADLTPDTQHNSRPFSFPTRPQHQRHHQHHHHNHRHPHNSPNRRIHSIRSIQPVLRCLAEGPGSNGLKRKIRIILWDIHLDRICSRSDDKAMRKQ